MKRPRCPNRRLGNAPRSSLALGGVPATLSLVILGLGLVASTFRSAAGAGTTTIARQLSDASGEGTYRPAEPSELRAAEHLFRRTFANEERLAQLRPDWAEMGFDLIASKLGDREVWILRESAGQTRGRGFYVWRRGSTVPIVLEAPHSFHDLYTREIALRLFRDSDVTAAAWNTLRRSVVDLAHTPRHHLNAFTQAFVRAHPTGIVVQLHGFSQEKRDTAAGATADLIISDGTRFPDGWTRAATQLFQRDFVHGRVRLYPLEVTELGATTNAQGTTVRQNGADGFLHLEMSRPLRQRMRHTSEARHDFLKILTDTYRTLRETEDYAGSRG